MLNPAVSPPEAGGVICALSDDPPFACFRRLHEIRFLEALVDEAVRSELRFRRATVTDRGETLIDTSVRCGRVLDRLGPIAAEALGTVVEHARTAPALFGDPIPDSFTIDARLLNYNDGDFFALHRDARPDARAERLVSFVYQFFMVPRRFAGGELRLHRTVLGGAPFVDIAPEPGLLTVFRPSTPHEVLPVGIEPVSFAGGRFALSGWLVAAE